MAENNVNGIATPNQAPAPTMQANAARGTIQPDPDALIELNVYGQRQVLPFKEAQSILQEGVAGRQALNEARRLRESVHVDREHAERWRTLELQLRTNPTAALEGMRNLARSMGAAVDDATFDSAAPPMNTDPQGNPAASALGRNTSDTDRRLAAVEQRLHQSDLMERVGGILNRYPAFVQKPSLRAIAERQILATMVVDPNRDPEEVARTIHTELHDAGVSSSPESTQVRDARLASRQVPNVSPNIGAGALQEGLSPATGASLDNGSWVKDTQAFLRRAQQGIFGPNPPGA